MCGRSLDGNREISRPTGGRKLSNRPASGRRGAIADDERTREVSPPALAKAPDPAIVAVKPTNKAGQPAAELGERRAGTEGLAGAGTRQGTAKHVPGAEPGKRVPGAGSRTDSRKAQEEGTVHHALLPPQYRSVPGSVPRAQA